MDGDGAMRLLVILSVLLAMPASADNLAPDGMFFQGGATNDDAEQAVIGMVWDWDWPARVIGSDRVDAHWDLSVGRWRSGEGADARYHTQFGITPALRYHFSRAYRGSWFVEAGIGLNFITPTYQNGNTRFSTVFNFGDHAAIGWRSESAFIQEVTLRFQHFSNASIRAPNPGENFLQLRFTSGFGR